MNDQLNPLPPRPRKRHKQLNKRIHIVRRNMGQLLPDEIADRVQGVKQHERPEFGTGIFR